MKQPLNILHLEDNPADAELVKSMLEAERVACAITNVQTRAEFAAALEKCSYNLILSDFSLPSFDGLSALDMVQITHPETPFIFVSGTMGEEAAVESLRRGAIDYVLKDRLSRLAAAVNRAVHEAAANAERRRLQEQLLRSQRMESIGALAGGIAHDLNNALVPILVGSQLLQQNNQNEAERQKVLEMIRGSAQRCKEMVKHILTFARGSHGKVGVLQLRHLIDEMAKIAGDTFPKSISIRNRASKELWNITGDATEMHQILMNLCVNARDAMPNGGQLTFAAENVSLSAEAALAYADAVAGDYVVVSVADTGSGMSPEVLARIFEPFFTTKAPDKGTGLGMSTVADIVKRYKGFIQVRSEVGKGTEFKIYLPATATSTEEVQLKTTTVPMGHDELILIVDDEQSVLELAKTTLEGHGYRVLTAQNGLEAITRFQANKDKIRLLVTDTDMPFLNGLNMIRIIQKMKPDTPILVASGGQRSPEQARLIEAMHLTVLNKPYDVEQLLNGVTEALNVAVKK